MSSVDPSQLTSYGPGATCTIDKSSPYYCSAERSVYGYKPSLAANLVFIIIFFIFMLIQTWQGIKWRTWFYMGAMILGCFSEIIGYVGRVLLWQNPFSFTGFMIQICCITFGPAFYSAAIYVILTKIVNYLGPQYSRLPPKAYYWIFIPCDLISLSLQGAGGGLSSSSSGSSQTGVDIAIAGLSFQVITLTIFIVLAADFAFRYSRGNKKSATPMRVSSKFKTFVCFLSLGITLILVRCAYRIAELHQGYRAPSSSLIHDQTLFIVLEGVVIVLAVACITVGHPGPVFEPKTRPKTLEALTESSGSEDMIEHK